MQANLDLMGTGLMLLTAGPFALLGLILLAAARRVRRDGNAQLAGVTARIALSLLATAVLVVTIWAVARHAGGGSPA